MTNKEHVPWTLALDKGDIRSKNLGNLNRHRHFPIDQKAGISKFFKKDRQEMKALMKDKKLDPLTLVDSM